MKVDSDIQVEAYAKGQKTKASFDRHAKAVEEGMVPFAVMKLCERNRNWRKKWQEILSNLYVLYAGLG